MKKFLQGKFAGPILAILGGLAVAVAVWYVFGAREWFTVRSAIDDIAKGTNGPKAQTALEALNDRAYVLKKLEDAVEGDSFDVRGKVNLLTTLNTFSQPRAMRRALDSRSLTAQRAACWMLNGDAEAKARCGEIALAWLRDEGAADRSMAASICGRLDVKEAQAAFLAIAGRDPRTEDDLRLLQQALAALNPKPPELADRLLTMAGNGKLDPDLRGIALEAIQRMKDGPRDRVLDLSIAILKDPDANAVLRSKAALGMREFPEDRAWQALEDILLSEKEQNRILQRNCLYALGQMSPADEALAKKQIDRLKQLLLDRRVYHNPYWGIRVDVTTLLAALNVREGITLDIMCDYLVDEDKDDRDHIVRQEGWLTLWVLGGVRFDNVKDPATPGRFPELNGLFTQPPQPFQDSKAARPFFFQRGQHRPGITQPQTAAVAKIAADLARMQEARQIFQQKKGDILDRWKADAEAAEAARQKKGAQAPGPVGPAKEKEEGSGEPKKEEAPAGQKPG